MFTSPASTPRCGTRWTGRGVVTSTSTWTGSASHSSARRKISTPTRSHDGVSTGAASRRVHSSR
ncbi:MAG: hypothetical protein U0797_27085 [Gemmataceae bacterium]